MPFQSDKLPIKNSPYLGLFIICGLPRAGTVVSASPARLFGDILSI